MKMREAFALSKGKKPTKLFEVIEYILSHGGEAKSRDLARLFSTPSVFYSSVSKAPGLERQGDTYRVSDALYEGYKVACSLVGKKPLPKDSSVVSNLLEGIWAKCRASVGSQCSLTDLPAVTFRRLSYASLKRLSPSLALEFADFLQRESGDSSGTYYSGSGLLRELAGYEYNFDIQGVERSGKPGLKLVVYDPIHTWGGLEVWYSSTLTVDSSTTVDQALGDLL